MTTSRFTDQNEILSDFYDEVWMVCPSCSKKAIARNDREKRIARLQCLACGYHKEVTMEYIAAACAFFEVELWLQHSFKNDVFYAYNESHLEYLEGYISASLREHKDRTGFTLLEKLPRFYHEAKNRDGLLAIIKKLKTKQ